MEKKKLSTGLTVWLWIIFVINILVTVGTILTTVGASALGFGIGYTIVCLLSVVAEIVLIAGISMMLFAHKKVGFYVIIAALAFGFVINLITYGMLLQLTVGNIVKSILSAVVAPLVIYLIAKKDFAEGVLA